MTKKHKDNDYTVAAIYRLLRKKKIDFSKAGELLVSHANLNDTTARKLIGLWKTSKPIKDAYRDAAS